MYIDVVFKDVCPMHLGYKFMMQIMLHLQTQNCTNGMTPVCHIPARHLNSAAETNFVDSTMQQTCFIISTHNKHTIIIVATARKKHKFTNRIWCHWMWIFVFEIWFEFKILLIFDLNEIPDLSVPYHRYCFN